MEKRVLKFELDVGTSSRLGAGGGGGEDVGKAMELVQRERDRDVKEKDELRHLNDRFSHFLSNIEQLKRINEQLQAQLKDEFSKWGILPRDENELQQIINQINDRAVRRATDEVRSRAAEQEAAILNRAAALYGNIQDMYKRKQENLRNLIDKLQEELTRLIQRERSSDEEVASTRDDLLKGLNKFRERLQDWLRIVVDKQTLLDDIQSLRERINLINALNDEEINEWKRLLEQTKDDSMSFYKDELTNAIRDIKRDYSKQTKKFQEDLEYQIEGQLRMVEDQLKQQGPGLPDGMQEAERNRMQMEETKLRTSMEEYDKEQGRVNELTKMLSEKRRALREEEAKLHEIERKVRERQMQEKAIVEKLKHEYEELRGRFEQMAFELRFSIEDELKIYSRLLDELMKKSNVHSTAAITTSHHGGSASHHGGSSSHHHSGSTSHHDGSASHHGGSASHLGGMTSHSGASTSHHGGSASHLGETVSHLGGPLSYTGGSASQLGGSGSASTITHSSSSTRIRSSGIEEREIPSTYHHTRTISSNSGTGPGGSTMFEVAGASSPWSEVGGMTSLGMSSNVYRSSHMDVHEGGSVTRSSSYSNLN